MGSEYTFILDQSLTIKEGLIIKSLLNVPASREVTLPRDAIAYS